MNSDRFPKLALGLVACLGLALSLSMAIQLPPKYDGVVAWVNGHPVTDPGGTNPQRVQLAIDRELLIQRGLAIGTPRLDRHVRSFLVGSMIARVTGTGSDDALNAPEHALDQYLRQRFQRTPIEVAPDVQHLFSAEQYVDQRNVD